MRFLWIPVIILGTYVIFAAIFGCSDFEETE